MDILHVEETVIASLSSNEPLLFSLLLFIHFFLLLQGKRYKKLFGDLKDREEREEKHRESERERESGRYLSSSGSQSQSGR